MNLKDCTLRVRVVPRTFRFKQPAGTSRGVYRERRTWYIVFTAREYPHCLGVGECAPLFDLSCDYDAHYEERLRGCCAEVERRRRIDYEALRPYPSILCGLETAERSFAASVSNGDYLHLYDTAFTRGEAGIPINGLVWMGNYEEMLARMERKLKEGYRCVKLKIGAIDFDSELELIRRLRARYSRETVELRVDANGAFRPEEALNKLELLARHDLHSIEQPIRAGQWEEMGRICRNTPLPVALDEELIGINVLEQKCALLDTVAPQYIILKPTLHGGFRGAEEWMDEARCRDIPYWVTSALESNIGLNAIAQWTSALLEKERRSEPESPQRPQGLGTGMLFTSNFPQTTLHIAGDCLWNADEQQRAFLQEVRDFERQWRDAAPTLAVRTSGSTGTPRVMQADKAYMAASARATCRFLSLAPGSSAFLCMPLDYIAGKMQAIRAFVCGLRLIAVAPGSHPFARLRHAPDFAAMTPMQVNRTLAVPREAALLRRVRHLIIGGGAISDSLARALRHFPGEVWSTYGMTETLSHIALRRLSGLAEETYTPLPGVEVTTGTDGRLVVSAPHIGVERLVTNDLADIHADGTFSIIGRTDNVVCSGGLKFHIEELEQQLQPCLDHDFRLTAVADDELGQALTLLYRGTPEEADTIRERCRDALDRHAMPRHIFAVDRLPLTGTGKPARKDLNRLAEELLQTERIRDASRPTPHTGHL